MVEVEPAQVADGPAPSPSDVRKISTLIRMRRRDHATLHEFSKKSFRRRRMPTSGMPQLTPACSRYDGMHWLPPELVVPDVLPADCTLPRSYVYRYYIAGSVIWRLYHRNPVDPGVPWRSDYPWDDVFPRTQDGWERPTSDDTFVRLRLQGGNPWQLRRVEGDRFETDYSQLFEGIFAPVRCRFELDGGRLVAEEISIGDATHRPGEPEWDQAKRIANGLDIRVIPFVRHLLGSHLVVGQAFALAAYNLPTWHRLRPLMHFFSYGTLQVSHFAYRGLLRPFSYFLMSGFITADDVRVLFQRALQSFDFDQWIVPRDIAKRGIDAIADHPYVDDARLVWPAFAAVVARHLDDLGLDDATVASDHDLQLWYLTLGKILPNTDVEGLLTRERLEELLTAMIYNNVVHEICGDLSPILGSDDDADKAIVNFSKLRDAVERGGAGAEVAGQSMGDVFLMDQASYVSRFNVTGNKMLEINAARFVDDPKLRIAIEDLQGTLAGIDAELDRRNQDRPVTFARMLPRNWEASISF